MSDEGRRIDVRDDEGPGGRRGDAPGDENVRTADDPREGEDETEREIDDARSALAEAEERLARVSADLVNSQRRHHDDVERARRRERARTLGEWLDVHENLERAAQHASDAPVETLRDGLVALHRQAAAVLERMDVERIPTVGEAFDPNVHDAVGRSPEGEPGRVVEEVAPGWRQADGTVIRAARVIVAG